MAASETSGATHEVKDPPNALFIASVALLVYQNCLMKTNLEPDFVIDFTYLDGT